LALTETVPGLVSAGDPGACVLLGRTGSARRRSGSRRLLFPSRTEPAARPLCRLKRAPGHRDSCLDLCGGLLALWATRSRRCSPPECGRFISTPATDTHRADHDRPRRPRVDRSDRAKRGRRGRRAPDDLQAEPALPPVRRRGRD